MDIVKVSSINQLLFDENKFKEITESYPWGFLLEIGKIGTFQVCPSPQFGETFRKNNWSFKRVDKK